MLIDREIERCAPLQEECDYFGNKIDDMLGILKKLRTFTDYGSEND